MAFLDIFNGDAFKGVELAEAIQESGYVPNRMRQLGLFKVDGITREGVAIERRDSKVSLVPVTPRGAPAPQHQVGTRDLQSFNTTRIAQQDRITASELDFVRAFGEEDAVKMAKQEVARRLGKGTGSEGILNNIGLTLEFMMLNLVKTGKFVNESGVTLVDWGTEMRSQADIENNVAFSIPSVTFDFATLVDGKLRSKLNKLGRSIARTARGRITPKTKYHIMVGDDFFDALSENKEVRNHYSRNPKVSYVEGAEAWNIIEYAGFIFENYRGTDDQSTVDIAATEGHGFPVNTTGIFKHYVSHGEDLSQLGTRGKEWYIDIMPDKERDRYVDIEVATYPLLACTAPQTLRKFVLA